MPKNPFQIVKEYFLDSVFKTEIDDLTRANYTILFTCCLCVVVLLIPLEIIYLIFGEIEPFQVSAGILGIVFFTSLLFYVKNHGSIVNATIIVVLVSFAFFASEIIMYEEMGVLIGLHLAVNLIFSVNLLSKKLIGLIILLHASMMCFAWGNDTFQWISIGHKIESGDVVLALASGIIMFLIVIILVFFNEAHMKMSKELTQSLRLLKIAKDSAEEMNELKSRFLANMSHEIRTPLNGILGISEILKQKNTDTETLEYLEIQNKSGFRLLNTIDGILSLSRLELKNHSFKLQVVDLKVIAQEVLDNQKGLAINRNIDLKLVADDSDTKVNVDEGIMYQAISNILGNAIKFTSNGGQIELRLFKPNADWIELLVKDSGIGISADFLNRIFEPFERDTAVLNPQYPGTGLGLSITKKFVELMGGNIVIESEVGKGSSFSILLPSAESEGYKD